MQLMSVLKKDNAVAVICVGFFLALCATVPLAQGIDQKIDRQRLMFDDFATMQWLQYQEISRTGRSVPLVLRGDRSVDIAGTSFTPAPGVTVVVKTPTVDTYCVRATNVFGDTTRWACLDEDAPPAPPSAPVDAI